MQTSSELKVTVGESDHKLGKENAPVVLVEYGDFQCPYCGAAYPVVKRLQEHFGSRLMFVFRNFPLVKSHIHALDAAKAAEAAAVQNKFWKMHDLLFEHQGHLNRKDIESYAQSLDLDMDRFDHDFENRGTLDHVKQDYVGGEESGVDGTPSFYINGRRYHGILEYDEMKKAIEEQLGPRDSAHAG